MICTCDACHYTFYADTLPSRCPDCGKEQIHRRVRERIIPSPAVRVATGEEVAWFENVRRELSSEESLERLSDGMTGDEYNWFLIMLFLHPMPKTRDTRLALATYLSAVRQDSEKASELHPTIRRMLLLPNSALSPCGDISAQREIQMRLNRTDQCLSPCSTAAQESLHASCRSRKI